ncbi:MAG: hypothetical protein GXO97_05575 [Nitrospirae bacterium]|nr:hypothetical protein [Nitrospirota bacterium]
MYRLFECILRRLIGSSSGNDVLKIDVPSQISQSERPDLKSLNSAFLIRLAGVEHPLYHRAMNIFEMAGTDRALKESLRFYQKALNVIKEEITQQTSQDEHFTARLKILSNLLKNLKSTEARMMLIDSIRNVFFPEGVGICERRQEMVDELREKRRVDIKTLNPVPIQNPAKEMIFTSNVLLTVPPEGTDLESIDIDQELKDLLGEVLDEEQFYWFDHPIQIGVDIKQNEAVYGLRGLSETLEFEKSRGVVTSNARLTCLLSVSVTHKGLHSIAKKYIEGELKKTDNITALDIYLFTEKDTRRLIEEIFIPAAVQFLGIKECEILFDIFGVDGEYGRHYSFLKAVVPLWSVLIDPSVRATFKIDLDQVFPEEALVRETGQSAFEHFKTPLWGATGFDHRGREIMLGMLAGALVNEGDIKKSLFTPDVCYPPDDIIGDEVIFFSRLPQALSTEAEMMTLYNSPELDGITSCIHRIHVTGGTTGILVDALRKWRPFTPSFIGRAEDQAYIMSVLFSGKEPYLRYLHKDGLIMRHDKEAFAQEAIKAAWAGKLVGDYVRMILFSLYAKALPWDVSETKEELDPFTGCFITGIPFTLAILRLTLRAATLYHSGEDQKAEELLVIGYRRLGSILERLRIEPDFIKTVFDKERQGWDLYYEIIDGIDRGIKQESSQAIKLREKAWGILSGCRLMS